MKFREKLAAFMAGRHGADAFGRFLSVTAFVLLIANLFVAMASSMARSVVYYLILGILAYNLFRMFSRNNVARNKENVFYLRTKNRIAAWFSGLRRRFQERKTHRYFRCPKCRALVRVPKGKGLIRITCPKCGNAFVKKS